MVAQFRPSLNALNIFGLIWTSFTSLTFASNVLQRQHFSLEEQEWLSNDYDVVQVNVSDGLQSINSTVTDNGHARQITVTIHATTTVFILDLKLNGFLFATDYIEKAIGNNTVEYINVDHIKDHCYYTGKVRGFPQSTSAVSTCHGISGYFSIESVTYHIVPISDSLSSNHKLFSTSDDIFQFNCGLDTSDFHQRPYSNFSNTRFKRSFLWPQDLDRKTKVVELYIVNDFNQYTAKSSNFTAVTTRTKTIVNIISSIYQPQDVYVVLVGTEVWTQSNKIGVSGNSSSTLDNFLVYRAGWITTKNDNSFLITSTSFYNGVVGKATVGTMCGFRLSGGIAADVGWNPPIVVAATMSHEMGHNFGLIHDTDACVCDDPNHNNCIMYPTSSSNNPSTTWSQCSKDQLVYAFQHGMDYCLYNKPPTVFDPTSVCGNGLVESGEQCDCGRAPASECNPQCCNNATCQLAPNAACAAGRCCNISSCQLKALSVSCRPTQSDCDLPEYCSGTDSNCPSDAYKQDGLNCSTINGAAAYCSQGKCANHQSQCQLLYGPQADSAVDACYTYWNMAGGSTGNCGIVWGQNPSFLPCSARDAMCGKLQCNENANKLVYLTNFYQTSFANIGNSVCNSVVFDIFDVGIQDPGLVPNGAKCGDGMMCLQQKCVSVNSISQSSCLTNCSQHGVCNNLGQCHCDDGFGTPDCSGSGSGGSSHSNPAGESATSAIGLIVGLCIAFLIILPLLVLCVVCSYRHRHRVYELYHTTLSKCRKIKTLSPQSDYNANLHAQPPISMVCRPKPSSVYVQPPVPKASIHISNNEELVPNRQAPPAPPPSRKPPPTPPQGPTTLPPPQRSNETSSAHDTIQNGIFSISRDVASREIPKPPPVKPVIKRVGYDNFGASSSQRPVSSFPPTCIVGPADSRSPISAVVDISDTPSTNVKDMIAQYGKRSGGHILLRNESSMSNGIGRPVTKPKPRKESFSNV